MTMRHLQWQLRLADAEGRVSIALEALCERKWEQSSLAGLAAFDSRTDGSKVIELGKKTNAFTRFLSQVVTRSFRRTENYRQFGTEEKCAYETFGTNRRAV